MELIPVRTLWKLDNQCIISYRLIWRWGVGGAPLQEREMQLLNHEIFLVTFEIPTFTYVCFVAGVGMFSLNCFLFLAKNFLHYYFYGKRQHIQFLHSLRMNLEFNKKDRWATSKYIGLMDSLLSLCKLFSGDIPFIVSFLFLGDRRRSNTAADMRLMQCDICNYVKMV